MSALDGQHQYRPVSMQTHDKNKQQPDIKSLSSKFVLVITSEFDKARHMLGTYLGSCLAIEASDNEHQSLLFPFSPILPQ